MGFKYRSLHWSWCKPSLQLTESHNINLIILNFIGANTFSWFYAIHLSNMSFLN